MGTRGFIGFVTPEGEIRGSYNHYDSYPDGAGADIQKELKVLKAKDKQCVFARLVTLIPDIKWVDATANPTLDQIDTCKKYGLFGDNVSTGKDWYSALREQQGKMFMPFFTKVATDEKDFLQDSLFCEWGYVMDFRSREFVIIKGFNQNAADQYEFGRVEETSNGYYGVREVWRGDEAAFLALDMNTFEASLEEKQEDA